MSNKHLFPFHTKIPLSEREEYRTYVFPGKEEVRIDNPQFLIVSDNGHRVFGEDGISHYIPHGWIHLYWKNKNDHTFYCENPDDESSDNK